MTKLGDDFDIKNGQKWAREAQKFAEAVSGLAARVCADGPPSVAAGMEAALHERREAQRVLRKTHGVRVRGGRVSLPPSLAKRVMADLVRFLFWQRLIVHLDAAWNAAVGASEERVPIAEKRDGTPIYATNVDSSRLSVALTALVGGLFVEEEVTGLLGAADGGRGVNFLTGRTASRLNIQKAPRLRKALLDIERESGRGADPGDPALRERLLQELRLPIAQFIGENPVASPLSLSRLHTEAGGQVAGRHDAPLEATDPLTLERMVGIDERPGPEHILLEKESLAECLQPLTEKQREAMLLAIEGYSRAEMSALLGIGEEAVKSRLAAGRSQVNPAPLAAGHRKKTA